MTRISAGRWEWIVLLAILAAGAGARIPPFVHHQNVDYDEGRYLDNAVHLLEGDGFQTSTLSHFFGDPPAPPRPEEISSPLYPLLLAGLFSVTGVSFAAAKASSLLFALATIPAIFVLARRLFGAAPALVAAAATALQPDQAIVGVWAMTEPLFTLIGLLALLAAAPWILAGREEGSRGRFLLAGLLLAALFLTRQNGAAFSAAVAGMILLGPAARGLPAGRRLLRAGLLALVVFAACSPWFVRNAAVFGSPTFTRMKNVAWAEHGRSLYTPGVGEPSWRSYLDEHGARGLAGNLLRRAERVAGTFLFAEAGPFRWLTLMALAAPLVPGLAGPSLAVVVPSLLSILLLMGVAPWSGALARYMLPIRPLLYAAGAAFAVWLWGRTAGRFSSAGRKAAAGLLLAAGAIWGAVSAAPVYAGYLRTGQEERRDLALEASAFVAERTPPGALLMEGAFLHEYAYLFRRGVVWTPYGDLDAALAMADRYGVRYLAISSDVLRFRPQLERNWSVRGGAIVPVLLPGRLRAVFDRAAEGLVIYEILPRAGGQAP